MVKDVGNRIVPVSAGILHQENAIIAGMLTIDRNTPPEPRFRSGMYNSGVIGSIE